MASSSRQRGVQPPAEEQSSVQPLADMQATRALLADMGYTTIKEPSIMELTEMTWGDIRQRRDECGADMLLATGAFPGDT